MAKLTDIKPSEDRKLDPFVFIGQVIETKEDLSLPIEIGVCAFLKKADTDYIQVIKRYLQPYFSMTAFGDTNHIIYENKPVRNEGSYHFERLPPEDWQYWIVTHTNYLYEENLNISIELSDIGLTPLLDVSGAQGRSYTLNPLVAGIYLEGLTTSEIKDMRMSDVGNIKYVRGLLDAFDDEENTKYGPIRKAITDFTLLKEIPRKSPFKFLGMFSIMELLLAHDSRNSNSTISGQLQSKISLLNSRFDESIDFQEYFGGPDTFTTEKYIEKMYSYRNAIAHGSTIDFQDKLQHIVSKEKVAEFVNMLLRKILVQSLKEPQLITDLKKC